MVRWFAPMMLAVVCGCGGSSAPTVTVAPPKPTGTPTDHKDYKAWKPFPVGTTVVYKAVTKAGETSMTSVETFKLLESTDDVIKVERQNTTERSDLKEKAVNDAEVRTFTKTFLVPEGMKTEDFAKPSMKAKQVGTETLTILGQPHVCEKYQWIDSTDKGPMTVTLWISPTIPGGRAKQTMIADQAGMTTVEEITTLTIPKSGS
jgi:hypothetical protein